MNETDRIHQLRKEISEHNHRYYVLDSPIISDKEFDFLLKELQALEAKHPELYDPNSPTVRVGGGLTESFETVQHEFRMYSLDNAYSLEELKDWEKRIHKQLDTDEVSYVCELKFDGASISITYENGQFQQAVTRGDGYQGDDVSANVRTIRSVPLRTIQASESKFYIRGEILLPQKEFIRLNQEREAEGLEPYQNPRNTASGSLKLKDSSEAAKRNLDCFLYSLVMANPPFETQYEMLEFARKSGFKVPDSAVFCRNIEEVLNFINRWETERKKLPFETDGVVVKVNSLAQQEELGYTSKSPRWALAYKFAAEQGQTILESISYQVGRTGAITPVANLKPLWLGGTTIRRASLHNEDIIHKLDVRLGDTVVVEKGGEIIPKIVGVNLELRPPDAKPLIFAERCPECQTTLIRNDGEAQHFCPNHEECPPQIVGRLIHYVSRKAMDIESMGSETIELLHENGLINTVADFYQLKAEDLLPLERLAEKSVQNILEAIEESKNQPFHKVLYGLGIRHVGETVAKKLVQEFPSIEAMANATPQEIEAVRDVGSRIAEAVVEFLQNEKNQQIIYGLKEAGVQLEAEAKEQITEGIFVGKTFLFTGKLHELTRTQAQELVENNGGKNLSAVSKNLDVLVAGEKAGSKLKKAQSIGSIEIWTEREFLEKVNA